MLISIGLGAQPQGINLEAAQQKAVAVYPSLEAGRMQVQQGQQLSTIPASHPKANLFISGEEFDFGDNRGIQSLVIQQNFNLPKTTKVLRQFYSAQTQVAQAQLALSEREINGAVAMAYFDLLYYQQKQTIIQRQATLYQDFEQLSQQLFKAGETGKIPLMTAQSKRQATDLSIQQATADYQIMLRQFNRWMLSDTLFAP